MLNFLRRFCLPQSNLLPYKAHMIKVMKLPDYCHEFVTVPRIFLISITESVGQTHRDFSNT